jgi:hypothetical protein
VERSSRSHRRSTTSRRSLYTISLGKIYYARSLYNETARTFLRIRSDARSSHTRYHCNSSDLCCLAKGEKLKPLYWTCTHVLGTELEFTIYFLFPHTTCMHQGQASARNINITTRMEGRTKPMDGILMAFGILDNCRFLGDSRDSSRRA